MNAHSRRIRAAVCHQTETPLRVEEVDLAGPSKGEVLVRTRACAICHSDISFVEGKWGPFPPTVFGHEVAGTVEATGAGCALNAGDRVLVSLLRSCGSCPSCVAGRPVLCETEFDLDRQSPLTSQRRTPIGHGLRCAGFAEYVTVHASQAVKIPDDVSFPAASVVACAGITGIGAVMNTAALPDGKHVVVIGAGGSVSTLCKRPHCGNPGN